MKTDQGNHSEIFSTSRPVVIALHQGPRPSEYFGGGQILQIWESSELLALLHEGGVEVVVLESTPGNNQIVELIAQIRTVCAAVKILVLLEHGRGAFGCRLLETGADDFIYREPSSALTGQLLHHKLEVLCTQYQSRQYADDVESRFWAFFEVCPIGLKIVDSQGLILRTNAAFQDFLGYSDDQLRGKSCQDFTHVDDLACCRRLFQEIFSGARDFIRLEKRFYHRDGTVRWGEFACITMRRPDGEPSDFLQMVVDLEQMRRLQEDAPPSPSIKELRDLAHDFNNLLAVIASNCYLLNEELDSDSSIARSVHQIMTTTERGIDLTRQLQHLDR